MKTFKKNYVGKGKQVKGLDIVKVTCKLEELVKFAHWFDAVQYVTLEVAKMKEPDEFHRTHTVYVTREEEAKAAEPDKNEKKETKKSGKKLERAQQDPGDDLPF